jgi:hypothetical protein
MKRFVKNEGELNTMGYVLLAAKKQNEALSKVMALAGEIVFKNKS